MGLMPSSGVTPHCITSRWTTLGMRSRCLVRAVTGSPAASYQTASSSCFCLFCLFVCFVLLFFLFVFLFVVWFVWGFTSLLSDWLSHFSSGKSSYANHNFPVKTSLVGDSVSQCSSLVLAVMQWNRECYRSFSRPWRSWLCSNSSDMSIILQLVLSDTSSNGAETNTNT